MASQRVRVCVVEYNWYLFSRVGETGRESQRKYERERGKSEGEFWVFIDLENFVMASSAVTHSCNLAEAAPAAVAVVVIRQWKW